MNRLRFYIAIGSELKTLSVTVYIYSHGIKQYSSHWSTMTFTIYVKCNYSSNEGLLEPQVSRLQTFLTFFLIFVFVGGT